MDTEPAFPVVVAPGLLAAWGCSAPDLCTTYRTYVWLNDQPLFEKEAAHGRSVSRD